MGTTNYTSAFIQVADDCPVTSAQEPPAGSSVAALQFALIADHPYELTSDDVLFEVHATRNNVAEDDRAEARTAFFARSQACLRASALAKRYGWGIHHDEQSRVALVPLGSDRYDALANDPSVRHLKAMRSSRQWAQVARERQ
ncbi:MAG: DUF6157 family protein [Micrococcales bacterium]|nr:DUF6157 family protein [Micrococcales bacterium]